MPPLLPWHHRKCATNKHTTKEHIDGMVFFILGMWMFFNSNREAYENAWDLPPSSRDCGGSATDCKGGRQGCSCRCAAFRGGKSTKIFYSSKSTITLLKFVRLSSGLLVRSWTPQGAEAVWVPLGMMTQARCGLYELTLLYKQWVLSAWMRTNGHAVKLRYWKRLQLSDKKYFSPYAS